MFDCVVGHKESKKSALKVLSSQFLAPSYLLKGPEGCQISLFLSLFVKKILCHDNYLDNCSCESCIRFDSQSHPDLLILDKAKYSPDDVFEIEQFTHTKSFYKKPKVVVLNDIGNMSIKAQNKLLKILEKPPKNISFFISLLGDKPLLPTIRSRTVLLEFFKYTFNDFCYIAKADQIPESLTEVYYRVFEGSRNYKKFYDLSLVRESLFFYFKNITCTNFLELTLDPPGNIIALKKIFKDYPFNLSLKLFCSFFLDRLSVYSGNPVFYNVDYSDRIIEADIPYKSVQRIATVLRRGLKRGHFQNEWLWLQGNLIAN